MLIFFVFFLLFILIFFSTEILFKLKINPELTRKIAHFLGGVVIFYMPNFLNLPQTLVLAAIFAISLLVAEKGNFLPSITKVNRKSFGSILFILGPTISAIIFWQVNILAFKFSVLVLSLSDSAAGLIGSKFGKHKILNGTIEGSIIFFLVTIFLFLSFGYVLKDLSPLNLYFFFLFSVFLSVIEGLSTKGFDNLFLPPTAAFLFFLLF